MNLIIRDGSPIPVYEQIIIQILKNLRENALQMDCPLPTIRQLASDLDITVATVAKVYQILERGKIIVTGGRRGTFFHENALENAEKFINEEIRNQMREFISLQLKYGVSVNTLQELFAATINEFSKGVFQ